MKALLIVAHGSRREESNVEVRKIATQLRQCSTDQYHIVRAAFLELADPLIPEGIKQCIDDGATSVIVLPYFLNSGRHVVEDIPRIVAQTRQGYPGIEIGVAPHLGASALMMDLLIATANTSR